MTTMLSIAARTLQPTEECNFEHLLVLPLHPHHSFHIPSHILHRRPALSTPSPRTLHPHSSFSSSKPSFSFSTSSCSSLSRHSFMTPVDQSALFSSGRK